MFSFLKKKSARLPDGKEAIIAQLLSNQLMLTGTTGSQFAVDSLEIDDDFALGYLFGMADMGSYQFGPKARSEDDTLNYICRVLTIFIQADARHFLEKILERQEKEMFNVGREQGANELGDWVKSQGQSIPTTLLNLTS
ncbi:hypothetical protein [Falsihalocynthiibacter sp. CO-5D18]|uniref:hypothetical protein n=1 Tax=Falsihalocynthiibacter sp. CO-5D18 TaxID=3240872 RepID=UPI0035104B5B